MNKDGLYQIKTTYAVFGLTIREGKVVSVAPIEKWMAGKTLKEIEMWVAYKNGTITFIGA